MRERERSRLRAAAGGGLGCVVTLVAAHCSSSTPSGADTIGNSDASLPHFDAQTQDKTAVEEEAAANPDATVDGGAVDAAVTCEAGLSACSGACTNLMTDPVNCGQCALACTNGTVCIAGSCVCQVDAGQVSCNDKCVPIATDPSNCGTCGHSCQGSACQNSLCQPTTIASVGGTIWGLAVDSTQVYWTQLASPQSAGAVSREPFAGQNPVITSVTGQTDVSLADPHGVAVDLQNLYWVDYLTGAVEAKPIMGSSPVVVLRPSLLGDGGVSDSPIDIVSDGTNVYWVTYAGGQVMSEPINGGAITVIASGENFPHAVAVDDTNVYWVDFGSGGVGSTNGLVKQAPKSGTPSPANVLTLAQDEAQPWELFVDATTIYWTDSANPGFVKSVPIGGGTVKTLASMQGSPHGIAADPDFVYWTDFNDNTVRRLPKDGTGEPFTIAAMQNNPSALAVDTSGNIWWVNQGPGTIVKVVR